MQFLKKLVSILGLLDRKLDAMATTALMVGLGLMISLTLLNMVLRWFNTTILWIEPLTRQLVFLAAFLGGVIATGSKSHIAIDLVGRILDSLELRLLKVWVERLIMIYCLVAVVWLSYAGYQLVQVEREFGKVEFLGIHSSVFIGVIPVGLLLIGYRFLYLFLLSFTSKDRAEVSNAA